MSNSAPRFERALPFATGAGAVALLGATLSLAATATADVQPHAITAITVREDVASRYQSVHLDLQWNVPDSAKAGDTFGFTLPASLRQLDGHRHDLVDRSTGAVVANCVVNGNTVTYTLTSYVDRLRGVHGGDTFEVGFAEGVKADPALQLPFTVIGGKTFTDQIAVTGTVGDYSAHPGKWQNYIKPKPGQAPTGIVYSIYGPRISRDMVGHTMTMIDEGGAGQKPSCTEIYLKTGTKNSGAVSGDVKDVSTAAYTRLCDPAGVKFTVTLDMVGRIPFYIGSSLIDPAQAKRPTFVNTGKVTIDGYWTRPISHTLKGFQDADGWGTGTLRPSVSPSVGPSGTDSGTPTVSPTAPPGPLPTGVPTSPAPSETSPAPSTTTSPMPTTTSPAPTTTSPQPTTTTPPFPTGVPTGSASPSPSDVEPTRTTTPVPSSGPPTSTPVPTTSAPGTSAPETTSPGATTTPPSLPTGLPTGSASPSDTPTSTTSTTPGPRPTGLPTTTEAPAPPVPTGIPTTTTEAPAPPAPTGIPTTTDAPPPPAPTGIPTTTEAPAPPVPPRPTGVVQGPHPGPGVVDTGVPDDGGPDMRWVTAGGLVTLVSAGALLWGARRRRE